ncbi:hypothetical protein [Ruoffia sp. FAM 26254]|uniref:hypothetical protein n=1 Tax=unclassified Ruoffia TaxID=2862149 RepID=UPI0038857689
MKEFLSASLKFQSINPVTEKKTTVTLRDLTQDAPAAEVEAVRDALQSVTDEPIGKTTSVETYFYG